MMVLCFKGTESALPPPLWGRAGVGVAADSCASRYPPPCPSPTRGEGTMEPQAPCAWPPSRRSAEREGGSIITRFDVVPRVAHRLDHGRALRGERLSHRLLQRRRGVRGRRRHAEVMRRRVAILLGL